MGQVKGKEGFRLRVSKRIAQSYKVNNSVATVLSYTRRHCGEQSSNCMPNTVATS